jgi:hypothetical protein
MQPFSIHEVGAAAILPPRDITVSQWADENRGASGARDPTSASRWTF